MTTEDKVKKIIFDAESVAHLRGYEREILPATDLIRELVDILKINDMIHLIKFEEFDGILKD